MALPDLSEYDMQGGSLGGLKKLGLGVMIAVVAGVLFLYIQGLPQKGGLEGAWKWESFWDYEIYGDPLGQGSVTLKLEQDGAYEQTVTPCVVGCRWCSGEGIPEGLTAQQEYEQSKCRMRHAHASVRLGISRALLEYDAELGPTLQPTYVTTGEYDIRGGRVWLYAPGSAMDALDVRWAWALRYDSRGNLNDDYLYNEYDDPTMIPMSLKKQ